MGDRNIGNNQERQGRDTPKPKADIRMKVLLKSIWQRCTARSQSPPSKLQARGRASKGPSGTASLRASARTSQPEAQFSITVFPAGPSLGRSSLLPSCTLAPAQELPWDDPSSHSPASSAALYQLARSLWKHQQSTQTLFCRQAWQVLCLAADRNPVAANREHRQ